LKITSFIVLISIFQSLGVYADELRIHVIKPKITLNWNSPATIATTSGLNSISDDFAPIGHFALALNCKRALPNGVNRVLTGMERVDKVESRRITINKKLGLGGVIYPFRGNLVSAKVSKDEIAKAKKQKRLKTVIVPISQVDCYRGLQFIEKWIKSASYKVYGGNKDTLHGEGAGCADFMSILFKVITGREHPNAWYVKVRIPKNLVGNGSDIRIPFSRVLTTFSWAKQTEDHLIYKTADTDTIYSWLKNRMRGDVYYYTKHIYRDGVIYSAGESLIDIIYRESQRVELSSPLEPFTYQYNTTAEEEIEVWNSISID
jgi:hypothetical protein